MLAFIPDAFGAAFAALLDTLNSVLPTAAVAMGIILLGWFVAVGCDALVRRLLARFERELPGTPLASGLGGPSQRTSNWLARGVRWLVLLLFVIIAAEAVGLETITSWLSGVATYVPRIFAAILIGFAASVGGRLANLAVVRAARSASLPHADRFGRLAQAAVFVALGLVAMDQLGIEVAFLAGAVEIVLAVVLGGAALAFGLGARASVENVLALHYVRRSFEIGQTVRIGDVQGRIASLDGTFVVIANEEGEAMIPAREFALQTSTKLRTGGRA